MAAADVLDALLSWRPYKEPYDIDKSMEIIKQSSGSHFEPCIARAVLEIKPSIEKLSKQFRTLEMQAEENEFQWRTQLLNKEL